MKRPIPTEAYWELKAKQLEIRVVQGSLRMSAAMRQSIGLTGLVVQMLKGVDGVLADAQIDTKILCRAVEAEFMSAVERVGTAVGLTGNPVDWDIDLSGPASASIQEMPEDIRANAGAE